MPSVPIVCPYTQLRPETKEALANWDVAFVDVSGRDSDYHWLLEGFWHRQQGVLIVEHDIVPYPGAIASLQACAEDYCGVPYLVGRNFVVDLGLTRFSAAIMAAYPDAVDRMEDDHWKSQDGQMLGYLRPLRGEPHWHWPAARHLNDCGDETRVLTNCPECGGPIRFDEARGGPNAVRCQQGHWVNMFPKG
jgi:hypothetical protein